MALFDQYAQALVWRTFASGDPLEDLGLAVQHFMELWGYDMDTAKCMDGVLAAKLSAALIYNAPLDDEEAEDAEDADHEDPDVCN